MSSATVTKSVRLSRKESQEIAQLSKETLIPQTRLIRKWVKEGLRAQKMESAIQAYIQRQTDLRGGAAMAGVSYNRFAGEIEQRQIVVLDDVDGFLKEMAFLADAFDHEELREVVKKVALERQGLEYDTRQVKAA